MTPKYYNNGKKKRGGGIGENKIQSQKYFLGYWGTHSAGIGNYIPGEAQGAKWGMGRPRLGFPHADQILQSIQLPLQPHYILINVKVNSVVIVKLWYIWH